MAISRIKTDGIQDDAVTSPKIADNPDFDGQFIRVPHGTTAQRPSSPAAGYMRFNTSVGTLEQWNTVTNSWQAIDSPPIITSLAYTGSATGADPAGGETITLTGTNFKAGASVTVGGTTAPSVSVVSSTSITFTTPAKTAGDYDIAVTNANGLAATLTDGISYNGLPAFSTAAGNVGSITEDATMSTITIVAAEPDGGTLAYSVTSGALPTGVTLGSANGQLTGTPNTNVTSDTTFNFTVTATDDENQTNARAFNLIVLRPLYALQIAKSLRFDSTQNSKLTRTPSSASNRKTFTFSFWAKRGKLGANQGMFGAESSGNRFVIGWGNSNNDAARFYSQSPAANIYTNMKFRDVSAWYHMVWAVDTTQGTAANRVKLYVNGTQVTSFAAATYPSQNADFSINNNIAHFIGSWGSTNSEYLEGYLSDVHFIDGQQLTPTSFAEEFNGVWTPKAFSGSYGTNGYQLKFGTSTAVGDDTGGGNNDWAPLGFTYASVSASSGIYTSSGRIENIFDGSTSTTATPSASTNNFIQWTAPTPINYTTSVEVYVYAANGYSITNYYSLNGGSETTFVGGGSNFNSFAWITLSSSAGTLNSIKIRLARSGSNAQAAIAAIRVDGNILSGSSYLGPNINQIPDSPTNNFATYNPLILRRDVTSPLPEFYDGNLKVSYGNAGGNQTYSFGTKSNHSGKWYYEVYMTATGSNTTVGIGSHRDIDANGSDAVIYRNTGTVSTTAGGSKDNDGASYANGDIIGIAYDLDNGTVKFFKNGTLTSTVTGMTTLGNDKLYLPYTRGITSEGNVANFGQDSTFNNLTAAASNADGNGIGNFKYAVPSGHLALCSKNLPESSINTSVDDRPEDYFNTKIYVGNGYPTTNGQTVSGVGFQSDFTWIKDRSRNGYNHYLLDSIRGATKKLMSNLSNAEGTEGTSLTSWNGDGFVLGANNEVNYQNDNFVSWNWKAGGTPTADNANTSGAMTASSVSVNGSLQSSYTPSGSPSKYPKKMSVNTKAGFSIVGWTGGGGSAETIPHGLGQAPEMMILKGRDARVWSVYHKNMASAAYYMQLNSTNAQSSDGTMFYSAAPDSNKFTVGSYNTISNVNYIGYLWHSVPGFSNFGTYVGTGSATAGPFIECGFKPAFLLLKCSTNVGNWFIWDNKRNTGNPTNAYLQTDSSNADATGIGDGVDFTSTGFKLRSNHAYANASGQSYIFMAFAEDPHKYSEGR